MSLQAVPRIAIRHDQEKQMRVVFAIFGHLGNPYADPLSRAGQSGHIPLVGRHASLNDLICRFTLCQQVRGENV